MSKYVNLQQAIDAGTSNMTVLRNNSKNDDSTTTYATGINWFKYNNVVVTNIYSSGNSWIGLGASAEHIQVNRRDCAVYYEYKETGVIGNTKFFKFRWVGYSRYNNTGDSYSQGFDLFLFDTNQIFLNFFRVPTSDFSGSNQLVCGSQTLNYSVSAGIACEWTFNPEDPVTGGVTWSLSNNRPDIDCEYYSSGETTFTLEDYVCGENDKLHWAGTEPEGTSITFYTKIDNGSYRECTNGGLIPDMVAHEEECDLEIVAHLETTDGSITPTISAIWITADDDLKIIVLHPQTPNLAPVIGDVTINYDGLGILIGRGGPLQAFSETFTPQVAAWKGNTMSNEHIEVNIGATASLLGITYNYCKNADEHIEVSVAATAVLTDVHDI